MKLHDLSFTPMSGSLNFFKKIWKTLFKPFRGLRKLSATWKNHKKRTITYPFFDPDKFNVEYAFHFAGQDYYCFADPFKIPYLRGLVALRFYEEFNMRMTHELLAAGLEAVVSHLNNNKASEAHKVLASMQDRLTWVVEPETMFKLASVMYFTSEETPFDYDEVYNVRKIRKWMEDPDQLAFFLQKATSDLAPFASFSPQDIAIYLTGAAKRTADFMRTCLQSLPASSITKEKRESMESALRTTEYMLSKLAVLSDTASS